MNDKRNLICGNVMLLSQSRGEISLSAFAKKKTKRFHHEIVISASHFRRLNFFNHSFFFQNTWKKKVFFWHLDFFYIGHLANPKLLYYLGKNGLKLNLEFKSSGVISLWILSL